MSDFRYDRDFLRRASEQELAQEVLNITDSNNNNLNLVDRLAMVEQLARAMVARSAHRPLQVSERIEAEQREGSTVRSQQHFVARKSAERRAE